MLVDFDLMEVEEIVELINDPKTLQQRIVEALEVINEEDN